MSTRIRVTGIPENELAVQQFKDMLPGEMSAAIGEGVSLLSDATHDYAAPISDSKYVRTMNYFNTQIESYAIGSGFPMSGYVETPAEYAIYLRGDGEGYEGAAIHVGRWESITKIMARLTPKIITLFTRRLEDLIRRTFK